MGCGSRLRASGLGSQDLGLSACGVGFNDQGLRIKVKGCKLRAHANIPCTVDVGDARCCQRALRRSMYRTTIKNLTFTP